MGDGKGNEGKDKGWVEPPFWIPVFGHELNPPGVRLGELCHD